MSDHKSALVPIGTGPYFSPDLFDQRRILDIGLLAEALLYYESVAIDVTAEAQVEGLLKWFDEQAKIPDLIALCRDGTLTFTGYNFSVMPFSTRVRGVPMDVVTLALTGCKQGGDAACYPLEYIMGGGPSQIISNSQYVSELQAAVASHFLVHDATDYRTVSENAMHNSRITQRYSLVVQAFVDEISNLRQLPYQLEVSPTFGPAIQGWVNIGLPGEVRLINLDQVVQEITPHLGNNITFDRQTVLCAECDCGRIIKSAILMNGDLYLGSPISSLAGDKLYESAKYVGVEKIIDQLKAEVAFPDVRARVNSGDLTFSDVLRWRKHSIKFRAWLQDESERDRNAIIAYHNEFGPTSRVEKVGRKSLQLFGIVAGAVASQALMKSLDASFGNADQLAIGLGGAAGGAMLEYLFEIGTGLPRWKPVVFGKWLSDRIKRLDRAS